MDPNGKVALVTGAGRRVGRALALALGDAGCRVAVHFGQSGNDAQETVSLIRSMGSEAIAIQADLEDPAQIESLTNSVAEQLGPIEILVNNASIFDKLGLEESSNEIWDRHFAINARAPFLLAQTMLSQLGNDAPGKIINLNDWHTARPTRFAYGVSKAALSGLTRTLALSMAPHVQVNELSLGAIMPPSDIPLDRPKSEIQIDLGPADRMGSLNEVADAMMMLVQNDFITGETINVDGGRHVQ
ncbi:MAG: SDR family oxidoreductase [Dehalococcoidia bacterium]|jgi:NAD(P)-dependent dehydrogenase (short-subunit alcohol dehydrogenase family)|nr:SDR family oxidoreductase [Dehalococcoidia bacterium]MDP7261694.1 SDR family oxidoreductase [Dehalococcoidia bacterium]MDP7484872.1 SDR family oxidoreductase [Dehalococcoidia bacterium]|tara:strand:- start:15013 stop:15744 length:732 start_codon:yes stop_codon:yes gene_type:complete